MNRKGMTLLELIIYIVLAGFLLVPVVFLMQKSSVSMVHDTSSSTLRTTGREVLNLMYDDLKNTGFKAGVTGTATVFAVNTIPGTWFGTTTPAPSFNHNNLTPNDSITVAQAVLNNSGNFVRVDTIAYSVADSVLMRTQRSGAIFSRQKVAFNVEALQFQYADSAFTWSNAPNATARRNARYIRVHLLLRDPKQIASVSGSVTYNLADVTRTYNDKSLREVHTITIPILNNGVFP